MRVKKKIPLYCIFVFLVFGCAHTLDIRSGSPPMADIKILKCELEVASGGKQMLTVYASSKECLTADAVRIKIYANPGGIISDGSYNSTLDHKEKRISTMPFELPSRAEQLEIVIDTTCYNGEPAVGTSECTLQ